MDIPCSSYIYRDSHLGFAVLCRYPARVLEQHFVRRVWCVDVDFGSYSSDGFIVYELCIFRTVSEAIHKLGCCL